MKTIKIKKQNISKNSPIDGDGGTEMGEIPIKLEQLLNKINIGLSQAYNSKNQNELNNNFTEKKLNGTANHLSVNSSPKKEQYTLPKLKLNIKEDNNKNKNLYSQKGDLIYTN